METIAGTIAGMGSKVAGDGCQRHGSTQPDPGKETIHGEQAPPEVRRSNGA